MMTFIVTYRDKSGAKREEMLVAVDRVACMAECRQRGISPMSVREGHACRDRSEQDSKGFKSSKGAKDDKRLRGTNRKRWLPAVLGVLTIAGILVLLWNLGILGGGRDTLVPEAPAKTRTLPKEVKPALPVKLAPPVATNPAAKSTRPAAKQTPTANKSKKTLTPEDEGYVSEDPTFAERYKRFKEDQAKLPFRHLSELEIYRIISTMPGETILPAAIHPNFEKDLVEHLDDPIVINDDDSAETKQDKETMIAVKAKLKQLMAEGHSPREILEAEQDHLVKVMNLRDNLFAELRAVEESAESLQEVEDYVRAANKMLEEYGAKNIRLPMSPARLRLLKLELAKEAKKNNKKESK